MISYSTTAYLLRESEIQKHPDNMNIVNQRESSILYITEDGFRKAEKDITMLILYCIHFLRFIVNYGPLQSYSVTG